MKMNVNIECYPYHVEFFSIDGVIVLLTLNFHVKAKAPKKTAAVQARRWFLWICILNL